MGREVILIISFLVGTIFLSTFVFADTENNPLNNKSLLQSIIDLLSDILEKLDIIAEKETTVEVTVEPNITVEPPEVTVNPNITIPNITLPDKECDWETYSQVTEVNLEGDGWTTLISVPENQLAKEINVTEAHALFKWTSGGGDKSVINVNGIRCLENTGTSGGEYYRQALNSSCLFAFDVGLNNIHIDNLESTGNPIGIKTMWIEMQIKPANC